MYRYHMLCLHRIVNRIHFLHWKNLIHDSVKEFFPLSNSEASRIFHYQDRTYCNVPFGDSVLLFVFQSILMDLTAGQKPIRCIKLSYLALNTYIKSWFIYLSVRRRNTKNLSATAAACFIISSWKRIKLGLNSNLI